VLVLAVALCDAADEPYGRRFLLKETAPRLGDPEFAGQHPLQFHIDWRPQRAGSLTGCQRGHKRHSAGHQACATGHRGRSDPQTSIGVDEGGG